MLRWVGDMTIAKVYSEFCMPLLSYKLSLVHNVLKRMELLFLQIYGCYSRKECI